MSTFEETTYTPFGREGTPIPIYFITDSTKAVDFIPNVVFPRLGYEVDHLNSDDNEKVIVAFRHIASEVINKEGLNELDENFGAILHLLDKNVIAVVIQQGGHLFRVKKLSANEVDSPEVLQETPLSPLHKKVSEMEDLANDSHHRLSKRDRPRSTSSITNNVLAGWSFKNLA